MPQGTLPISLLSPLARPVGSQTGRDSLIRITFYSLELSKYSRVSRAGLILAVAGASRPHQEETRDGACGPRRDIADVTMMITADIYEAAMICCALCQARHVEPQPAFHSQSKFAK